MTDHVKREVISVLDGAKFLSYIPGALGDSFAIYTFELEREDSTNRNEDTRKFLARSVGEAMILCANEVQRYSPRVIGFKCVLIQEIRDR